jgi:hypothetical protein
MRQISVATTSDRLSMPNAAHHSRPAKIAPSAIRSHVASSTAPKRRPPPRSRAIAPSSMSASTNTETAKAPQNNSPIGNRVSAARTLPAVPRIVMLSGVKPSRSAPLATGRDSLT